MRTPSTPPGTEEVLLPIDEAEGGMPEQNDTSKMTRPTRPADLGEGLDSNELAPVDALLIDLRVVKEQQQESQKSIKLLQRQHKQWQAAIDAMLARVDTTLAAESAQKLRFASPQPSKSPPSLDQHSLQVPLHTHAQKPTLDLVRPPTPGSPGPAPCDNEVLEEAMDTGGEEDQVLEEAMDTGGEEEQLRKSCLASTSAVQLLTGGGNLALRKIVAETMEDSQYEKPPLREGLWPWLKATAFEVVTHRAFEFFIGAVIATNMICLGIETELSLYEDTDELWPTHVEWAFASIYLVELFIRLLAGGLASFTDIWFLLDVLLVSLSFVSFIGSWSSTTGSSSQVGWDSLLVVRGLRLLRLARAVRMARRFKVIWKLVYGLLSSGQTMFSTFLLIMLSLYIFACIGLEVITKDPKLRSSAETADIVTQQFGSLPLSVMTLIQFVTLDSVSGVYAPLVKHKPELVIYFMPILMFVSIALMNLVTAVLVEGAFEQARHEEELQRIKMKQTIKKALPHLLEIFQRLDSDGSGCISEDEVKHVPLDILPSKLLDSVSVESMVELFELLDVDGTGELTQVEFVEGLLNLFLLDVPISQIQTLKLLRSTRAMVGKIERTVESVRSHLKLGRLQPQHHHLETPAGRKRLAAL